jgi:glyoxylase-like metal-dependent hydrolase (beta-lactamase superfamily II)
MRKEMEQDGILVFERGWLSSNNILLLGDNHHESVLVDTGYWAHASQTVSLVKRGLAGQPLGRVLNTHLHSDHCGGNAAVQHAFDAHIDVPSGEAAIVDAWDEDALTYRATGQYCPRFVRSGSVSAPSKFNAGRHQWEAIASPGHDPRSIALYQPDLEVLISADALWENGFGIVFPELDGDLAFEDVAETLALFSRLSVRWVIPGHGAPFSDVPGAITRATRRLENFVQHPRKHATHAAKVLLKFRLLETQAESWESIQAWVSNTSYFETIRVKYFSDCTLATWIELLILDMAHHGALAIRDGCILNSQ